MQRNCLKGWLALVGGLSLCLAAPTAALAQAADPEPPPAPSRPPPDSGIEEIVIQGAESESVRDFEAADSVTGFGAEDLAALGAQDIADLAAFTPNLEIVTSGATTPTFFIRGVGLNDFNSNSTGAVSIYQDDVARNAPALQLSTLFDIEAVNVLRGPQGTGLARNSSAGAIKIYSRKPTGEFGGFLRSELGNFNLRDFEGALEAPLYEDMVAGRFAFRFTERDGTMKNRCGNAPADADKVPVPPSSVISPLALTNRDAPWSICAEPVPFVGLTADPDSWVGISPVPAGLAPWVNNVNNWAGRGTLLFQPTLDMSWLLNAHGSRRNELSRLGQSIGVGGPNGFSCLNGDVENCFRQDSNQDARIEFLLGAQQGVIDPGYQVPEIRARWEELADCFIPVPAMNGQPGRPDGTCRLNRVNGELNTEAKRSADAAKKQVAKELAEGLDSEPWEGDFNRTGPTQNDLWGAYVKGDISLPAGMQLTSVTAFDTYDRVIDIDLDFSPETLFQILTEDQGWQVYNDLRLEGQLGDEYPLRWDIGAWFLRESLDVLVTNDLGTAAAFGVGRRDYTQDLWSSAGYASLGVDLGENFTLDGGFRYNWEQKKLDYSLFQSGIRDPVTGEEVPILQKLDETWLAPTGTVRLTYRFREDTHAFWKYTRGWKPGTFNATSSPGQGVSAADPETIDAFETGLRGSWLEGRLGADFSFFYYNYDNYQLFTAQQFANGQPEFVILNAPSAEVYGAELDLVTRPWIGAFINARIGWLESQFLDFTQIQQASEFRNGAQQIVNRELQNSGHPLLNSPRFKVSLTGEQTLPLGRWGSLTARYDGVWTDITYYDATQGLGLPNSQGINFYPEDTISQPAFWLHNLRLSYRLPGGRVEVAGFIRNIANQAYKTFAFDGSTFNNTSIYFVGDPRTFGGTLSINF